MDAFSEAFAAIKPIFDAEFADQGVTLMPDNLHASLGRETIEAGMFPLVNNTRQDRRIVQESMFQVKYYDLWPEETGIDPAVACDPRKITALAERFSSALKAANTAHGGTSQLWFFDVERIEFPDDPTGNKTRFVATIRAQGQNPNLVETS